MVGSASITIADQKTGEPFYYLMRHLAALMVGGGAVASRSRSRASSGIASVAVAVRALGLLVAVLLPGVVHTANGSTRWIDLGPLNFQASEPARLCLLLYVASYAVRRGDELAANLKGLVKPMALVTLAAALLLLEPDYGSTVVLLVTSLGILFVAGARLRDFGLAVVLGGVALGVLAVASPYRLERLMQFLNPWADAYGGGFQLTQSLIAIGRGEWFGVGLGESACYYLPAHRLRVRGARGGLGFAGATLVVVLFGIIVYPRSRSARALRSSLPFRLVCYGIGPMLGFRRSSTSASTPACCRPRVCRCRSSATDDRARSSLFVSACCSDPHGCTATSAAWCSAGTAMTSSRPSDHGRRHQRRVSGPGSRRALRARRSTWCGSARSAGSRRGWCPDTVSTSSGSRSRACAGAASRLGRARRSGS
jgi:cell division protein FtsW